MLGNKYFEGEQPHVCSATKLDYIIFLFSDSCVYKNIGITHWMQVAIQQYVVAISGLLVYIRGCKMSGKDRYSKIIHSLSIDR